MSQYVMEFPDGLDGLPGSAYVSLALTSVDAVEARFSPMRDVWETIAAIRGLEVVLGRWEIPKGIVRYGESEARAKALALARRVGDAMAEVYE